MSAGVRVWHLVLLVFPSKIIELLQLYRLLSFHNKLVPLGDNLVFNNFSKIRFVMI